VRQSQEFDLLDATEAAYRCARALVFDVLPIGRLDDCDLSVLQRTTLAALADAEADVKSYRRTDVARRTVANASNRFGPVPATGDTASGAELGIDRIITLILQTNVQTPSAASSSRCAIKWSPQT
jgi:hypothetical protein